LLGDRTKMFALEWLIGGLLAMLVFWIIRRSPAPLVVLVLDSGGDVRGGGGFW